jgi:hypothetical protein
VNCAEVKCALYTLTADNGDPIMLFGEDEAGNVMLWPTCHAARHPIAFARWTKRNAHRWRGKRLTLQHDMEPIVERWARWLGCRIESGVVVV